MKSEVYKIKMNSRGELLARIFNAAARVKKSENQLTRTERDIRTRDVKSTEVEGWILEHLL